jgi:hypothetical protein
VTARKELIKRCRKPLAENVAEAVAPTREFMQKEFRETVFRQFSEWLSPFLSALVWRVESSIPGFNLASRSKNLNPQDLQSVLRSELYKARCSTMDQVDATMIILIRQYSDEFASEGLRLLEIQAQRQRDEERQRQIREAEERRRKEEAQRQKLIQEQLAAERTRLAAEERRRKEEEAQRQKLIQEQLAAERTRLEAEERHREEEEEQRQRLIQEQLAVERPRRDSARHQAELAFVEHAVDVKGVFGLRDFENWRDSALADERIVEDVEKNAATFPTLMKKHAVRRRLRWLYDEFASEIEDSYSRDMLEDYIRTRLSLEHDLEAVVEVAMELEKRLVALAEREKRERAIAKLKRTKREMEKRAEGVDALASAIGEMQLFDEQEREELQRMASDAADRAKTSVFSDLLQKETDNVVRQLSRES